MSEKRTREGLDYINNMSDKFFQEKDMKTKSVFIFYIQYDYGFLHVTDDDFDTIFCKCRILSTNTLVIY